jgi:hypothetical protein
LEVDNSAVGSHQNDAQRKSLTRSDVIAILEDKAKANDFSRRNLKNVDLSGLKLQGCNFASSTLTQANFSQCHLLDANFSHAACREANFAYADLSRADFSFAYLREADFSNAHLYRATLDFADCREANLALANLHRASLQGVQLDGESIGGRIIQDDPVAYRLAFERVFRHRTDREQAQRTIERYVRIRRRIAEQVWQRLPGSSWVVINFGGSQYGTERRPRQTYDGRCGPGLALCRVGPAASQPTRANAHHRKMPSTPVSASLHAPRVFGLGSG